MSKRQYEGGKEKNHIQNIEQIKNIVNGHVNPCGGEQGGGGALPIKKKNTKKTITTSGHNNL
eukprot:12405807-Karenia_brevis.AAC.1